MCGAAVGGTGAAGATPAGRGAAGRAPGSPVTGAGRAAGKPGAGAAGAVIGGATRGTGASRRNSGALGADTGGRGAVGGATEGAGGAAGRGKAGPGARWGAPGPGAAGAPGGRGAPGARSRRGCPGSPSAGGCAWASSKEWRSAVAGAANPACGRTMAGMMVPTRSQFLVRVMKSVSSSNREPEHTPRTEPALNQKRRKSGLIAPEYGVPAEPVLVAAAPRRAGMPRRSLPGAASASFRCRPAPSRRLRSRHGWRTRHPASP